MKEINSKVKNIILNSKWLDENNQEISFQTREEQILVVNNKNKIVAIINDINSITINKDNIEIYHVDINDSDESLFISPLISK